jgi:hypothetical protein
MVMKIKLSFFLFFILICFNISGQQRKSVLLKTSNVGQIATESCWAASTQMLLSAYENNITDIQCKLIFNDILDTSCYKYISCSDTVVNYRAKSDMIFLRTNTANPKHVDELVNEVFTNRFKGFSFVVKQPVSNFHQLKNSIQVDLGNDFNVTRMDSLDWASMKHNFDKPDRSPMCLYKHIVGNSHVTVFCGYEHTKLNKKQMKWIFVKDPWPQNQLTYKGGSQYVITYEFYKKKDGSSSADDDPQNP